MMTCFNSILLSLTNIIYEINAYKHIETHALSRCNWPTMYIYDAVIIPDGHSVKNKRSLIKGHHNRLTAYTKQFLI